ncbi:N-acetylmuramoyl-L-alanine amidase [Actinoplanes palleronii]|uniref:Peptidoglycan recognition protein family domain-containing protein n=1 Tax=Actinoplanes palleronii TaxID=113570 RepID=A0ABQ4BCC1_9ACTN|nr:N-acetylmuramoyl-L-alanine amidase [Actinoplanes palleronii]GIE68344.1 hypothetical protein Apa02nite_044520 [Actinoplanes palleronii]
MKRRATIGIGAAVAVLAAAGGVAALTLPSGPATGSSSGEDVTIAAGSIPPDPAATPPDVHAEIDSLDLAASGGAAELPQRSTRRFSMVSVSWDDPADAPQGRIEVRARSAKSGKWSGWQALGVAEAAADRPDEAARAHGATDPIWTGRSDGVAARIAGGRLPAALKVNLIDPDARSGGQGGGAEDPSASPSAPEPSDPVEEESPEPTNPPVSELPTAPTTAPVPSDTPDAPQTTQPVTTTPSAVPSVTTKPPTSSTTAPSTVPTSAVPVPTSTVPVKAQLPPYVSRAGWKANEALVTYAMDVASQAKLVWVHHTGFGNSYTCADSASVIRGIQVNDIKVKELSDLGYNFVVDQCGTLFEGRKGGVTKAVIGAHAVGFNTGSIGIALLGDYTTAKPSTAALTTIAQVAAARLGAYGYNPASTTTMTEGVDGRIWPAGTSVTFPRIAGHQDGQKAWTDQKAGKWGYLTECPGVNLSPQLDTIRILSQRMITGLTATSLAGGISVGGVFYVRTAATINWSVATASASIATFEVLRDGKVAATLPGTARTAKLTLTPGTHTVQVRATHTSGATGVTGAYKIVADVTAPGLSGPSPYLRAGTYSTTSVPVTVLYKATDNARVYTVTAAKPSKANLAPAGTSWYTSVRPGVTTAYALTVRDVAGNTRTTSVTRKVTVLPETKAKRGGTWATRSSGSHLSGKALAATKKNAKLTYAFTGRSAALLFSRGSQTGKAYVYLDGKKIATIDTKASGTKYRQAVWVKALTPGKHTVAVVVAGTSGRPAVVSDGLAYVN